MPFFTKALGQAGKTAEEVERIVERFENPAIQAVGTTGNIAGSVPKPDTEPPATDITPSGSPMAYLTGNLETLESHVQAMSTRSPAGRRRSPRPPDEQAAAYDVAAQEKTYGDREVSGCQCKNPTRACTNHSG